MTNHSPDDFAPVIPCLTVKDEREALNFYARVFDAKIAHIVPMEDGAGVLHARFFVNDSMLMLCKETPDIPTGAAATQTIGGTPVTISFLLHLRPVCAWSFSRGVERDPDQISKISNV